MIGQFEQMQAFNRTEAAMEIPDSQGMYGQDIQAATRETPAPPSN
jgi:hypothetical protein